MALLCSVYEMEFRNLVNFHELAVRKDATVKLYFVPADPPYNVQKDLKDALVAYDVFA